MKPEPFEIAIPDSALSDLRERLARSRWPKDPGNTDWRYGVPRSDLAALVDYWRDDFDWRAQEAAMNRHRHYQTEIDGVPIHFMHVPAVGPNAIPLVLTHGWPWTFWDFRDVLGPLSNPAAYGQPDAPAFELIVPSLPGSKCTRGC